MPLSVSNFYHVQQLYADSLRDITVAGGSMKTNGSDKAFNETRDKIRAWLTDAGYTLGRNQGPGTAWAIDASDPSGFGFSISQNAGHPESVFVNVSGKFDMYQRDIKALSKADSKDLIFTLRQRLLLIGAVFVFSEGLKEIAFHVQLFTETLNREKFWAAANTLRKALDCTVWTLDEKLPEPPTS